MNVWRSAQGTSNCISWCAFVSLFLIAGCGGRSEAPASACESFPVFEVGSIKVKEAILVEHATARTVVARLTVETYVYEISEIGPDAGSRSVGLYSGGFAWIGVYSQPFNEWTTGPNELNLFDPISELKTNCNPAKVTREGNVWMFQDPEPRVPEQKSLSVTFPAPAGEAEAVRQRLLDHGVRDSVVSGEGLK
jgi:hypothetical protein